MAVRIKLVDVRLSEVAGDARVLTTITRTDGSKTPNEVTHTPATPVTLAPAPDWVSVEFKMTHPNYLVHTWSLTIAAAGAFTWNDPCVTVDQQGPDSTFTVPLGRIQQAPGQFPQFGGVVGGEKGVVVHSEPGQPQKYVGTGALQASFGPLRLVDDVQDPQGVPKCIVNRHTDDGWQRLITEETASVDVSKEGGLVWLEYGSLGATQLKEPRFLIALWAPEPAKVVKDDAVDMLVFFSPSTATTFYPVSTFPFRDKYPYEAHKDSTVDENGVTHPAKVQPYVILGLKYLFSPNFLAAQSAASGKPLLLVVPVFPHVAPAQEDKHMWQPFRSKAGLHRLLLEICQFLQREGYNDPSFSFKRWNGAVAPIAGTTAPPPQPVYTRVNRKRLAIRNIVVSGYSSASAGVIKLFQENTISASAADYPPDLFGADPAEFDKRWQELWTLDFFLARKHTGITIQAYEKMLTDWIRRDTRHLRIYHSGHTTGDADPDTFYPGLRKQLAGTSVRAADPSDATRWGVEWRVANNRWSALFFSTSFLWSKSPAKVLPGYPIEIPSTGKPAKPPVRKPAGAIHPFTLELGFGHASKLRSN